MPAGLKSVQTIPATLLLPVKKLFLSINMLISHPSQKGRPAKPLTEHLFNVADKCRSGVRNLNLDLSIIKKEELEDLAFIIGLFHDFGKATSFFQEYIRNPGGGGSVFTRHSTLSAHVARYVVQQRMDSPFWAQVVFQVIRCHHGNLQDFDCAGGEEKKDERVIEKQLQNILGGSYEELSPFYIPHVPQFAQIPDAAKDIIRQCRSDDEWEDLVEDFFDDDDDDPLYEERRIELFLIVNLLFSLLTDNDKQDAARLETSYFSRNLEEPFSDAGAYLDHLRSRDPGRFSMDVPINGLRSTFFDEVSANGAIAGDNYFYTLTAPTGIGKTLACMAFARRLMGVVPGNSLRVVYCLPYTSIIDQNYDVFREVIRFHKGSDYEERPARYLLKHHYLASRQLANRKETEVYGYSDYRDDVLLVESWQSSMVVTTFVQFFHSLIGGENRLLKKFHHIINSLVILDEVQDVDPNFYRLLRKVLHVLGKRFRTYFLLTTATQPEILDPERSRPVNLVDSGHYMRHPVFNRVRLRVERKKQSLEIFIQRFCREFKGRECLLVMNTKKAALTLFNALKQQLSGFRFFCLTTLSVPADRRRIIADIKTALQNKEPVIAVSTQMIEAGVDLSFQRVYRDFGPLDSIIQVAGRCNRSGEYGTLGGEMTVVNLTDVRESETGTWEKPFHEYVYNSFVIQTVEETLVNDEYESAQFAGLAETYFRKLDFTSQSRLILNAVCGLRYDGSSSGSGAVKDFRLIKEYDSSSLYILTTPEAEADMLRLLSLREIITSGEMPEDELDAFRLEVETLKTRLRDYCVSLRESELAAYSRTGKIKEEDYYWYIGYEDQRKYAYDADTGFLTQPKEAVSGAEFF